MNNEKGSNKNKRTIIVVSLLLIILLILFLFNSCGKGTQTAGTENKSTASQTSTPSATTTASATTQANTTGNVIEDFYAKKIKHGKITFLSGTSKPQLVEYWFDNNKYRLTWYNEDGSIRMHMISPDGVKLYYCYVADKVSKIAYVLPEKHQWLFVGPPGWSLGAGVKDGDLTAYKYTAKKLWDIAGSSQQFYLEDMVVYSDGKKIVKVVTRTTSHAPKTEADLVSSTYQIDTIEYLDSIPADVFTIPYPIKTE